MTAEGRPLVPEELLAHAGFVRALAARLLDRSDAGIDADDVAQETWLAALRAPPREPERVKSWLGRVIHRFAFERHRSAEARERRERGAARDEALVSAQELAAKDETLRLVADSVLALDEKARAVLLLRYYDGAPTSEVARKLGLPVETTRSRLKRAIELLRLELDQRAPGGREQWLAVLALAVESPRLAVPVSAPVSMSAVLSVGLLVAATVVGVTSFWSPRESIPAAPAGVKVAAEPIGPIGSPVPAPATRTPEPVREEPLPAPAPARKRIEHGPKQATGAVVVSVVDLNGRPVTGETMISVRRKDRGRPHTSLDATFDIDHSRITYEDAPAGEVEVEVNFRNRPQADLHAFALVNEGQTTSLTLRYEGPDPANSICVGLKNADVEGSFNDLIFDRLVPDPPPVAKLVGADGRETTPKLVSGYLQSILLIAPLDAGSYELVLGDRRWQPVRVGSLHPGDAIAIDLIGSAAIRLLVRSDPAARPITDAVVTLEKVDEPPPGITRRPQVKAAADGTFLFSGLAPVNWRLVVSVEGRGSRDVEVAELDPGETRAIELVLSKGDGPGTLEGRLVAKDGRTPMADQWVLLYAPAEIDDSAESQYSPSPDPSGNSIPTINNADANERGHNRIRRSRARTDVMGRFRFEGLPLGRWVVTHLSESCSLSVDDRTVLDSDHPARSDLLLVESEGATIVGRLATTAPADFTGVTVRVEPTERMFISTGFFAQLRPELNGLEVPIGADGSFRLGPIDASTVKLSLRDKASTALHASPGSGIDLTTVESTKPGVNKVVVPADLLIPGSIQFRVTIDDLPAAGILSTAIREKSNSHFIVQHSDSDAFTLAAKSDENGRCELPHLLPGRFRVATYSPADGWLVEDVATVDLAAGAVVQCAVPIRTATATLTILDGAGEPIREREIAVGSPLHGRAFGATEPAEGETADEPIYVDHCVSLRTNSEGMVELRWPVGRIAVGRSETAIDNHHFTVIDWPPASSNATEVRLP
jgi:RNA polymerase sigma-70 factor (ECF subfamily)